MANRTVIVEPEPYECVPHGLLLDKQISANTLRVYLILRKHRDYDTSEAWPGLARIGEAIGISSRTVQRCISELVAAGYVCIEARFNEHGGRTSNLYHVHYDKSGECDYFTPSDTSDATPTTPMSPTPTTPVSTELRPIDIQNPRNEEELDHFAEFWSAYPRKKGKGQARTAWAKAVKKTTPAVLIHAAVQFRQWCEQDGTENQFIPHPSTWLNGERWTDERDPEPPTRIDGWIALFNETVDNDSQGYPQIEGGT